MHTTKDRPTESKEPKEEKKPVRSGVGKMFYLDEDLNAALEAFMESQRIPPSQTAVFEAAIRMLLESEGFWPPPQPKDES